ncbi:MAG: TMEM165/GDT1 family protein [Candidatus Omnitrophica bacterium]|nr:TMEM165/GDT1 family protein [Candidatus Omnitrophota bacterium]
MDWRIVTATFGMVFVSELGDKTWLAIISTSAASQAPASVLTGAILALICSTLAAVGLGWGAGFALPAKLLRAGVGVSFILCGLWFLLRP